MVHFARERCNGCGACINDCLVSCIALDTENKAYAEKPELCFGCAHCAAICPTQAPYLDEYDMNEMLPYNAAAFSLPPEVFLNAVKFRRSVRNFKPEPPPRALMCEILEAGRFTETASNRQAQRFVVVQDSLKELKPLVWDGWNMQLEALHKNGGLTPKRWGQYDALRRENPPVDRLFFNAPALLVIGGQNPIDAGMALANIEHLMVAHGLGMVVMGLVQSAIMANPAARAFIGLEDIPVSGCALFGYPAVRYHRTVPRKEADVRWL